MFYHCNSKFQSSLICKCTLRFLNYKHHTEHYNTTEIYIDIAMSDSTDEYCNLDRSTTDRIRWHHSPFDYNIARPYPNCPDCDPFRSNLVMVASKRFPFVSVFVVFSALQVIYFFYWKEQNLISLWLAMARWSEILTFL